MNCTCKVEQRRLVPRVFNLKQFLNGSETMIWELDNCVINQGTCDLKTYDAFLAICADGEVDEIHLTTRQVGDKLQVLWDVATYATALTGHVKYQISFRSANFDTLGVLSDDAEANGVYALTDRNATGNSRVFKQTGNGYTIKWDAENGRWTLYQADGATVVDYQTTPSTEPHCGAWGAVAVGNNEAAAWFSDEAIMYISETIAADQKITANFPTILRQLWARLSKFGVASVNGKSGVVNLSAGDVGAAEEQHAHEIADVNNLQKNLDNKAALSHGHAIADVSGLQAALNGKAAASHTHNYLPLSGGTMTGKIIAPRDFINRDVDTDWITIVGGTSWESSGRIQLFGGKHANMPGYVTITATDGTNTNSLQLRPDGKCFVAGKHVVRSVNGIAADAGGNVVMPGLITSVREIPANADLNDYTTPGYWNVQSDATAETFTNCPVKVSFTLEVYGSSWMTYQRITRYLTGEMWVRTYYSTRGWSEWREVALRAMPNNATLSALHGGMKYGDGASLLLWGMNHNNGTDAPGMFKLRAVNSAGTYSELIGTPNGGMTWNSVDITLGYPNYAAGTNTTASTYTAAADGWVMVKKQQEGKYLNIKVNGYLAGTGGGSDHDRTTAMFPVKAADVVTVFASNNESTGGTATTADITFFPNR